MEEVLLERLRPLKIESHQTVAQGGLLMSTTACVYTLVSYRIQQGAFSVKRAEPQLINNFFKKKP